MPLLAQGLNPTAGLLAQLGYFYPPGQQDAVTAVSHWICGDPNSQVSTPWSTPKLYQVLKFSNAIDNNHAHLRMCTSPWLAR